MEHIRAKLVSDKSPLFAQLQYTREDESAAAHDVLVNQFCLLPQPSPNQAQTIRSVDKVVLCWSELLQRYSEDDRMQSYVEAIKNYYHNAKAGRNSFEVIKTGIQQLQNEYRDGESFHHVVTELAFMEARASQSGSVEDIVPVLLNGDFNSRPGFGGHNPVWLKPSASSTASPTLESLHSVFFRLLRRIFDKQSGKIAKFEECYAICSKQLQHGTDQELRLFVGSEIEKCLDSLNLNHAANLRNQLEPSVPRHGKFPSL